MTDERLARLEAIAYRLARELEDLIELAGVSMHEANSNGAEYDVDDELHSARQAVDGWRKWRYGGMRMEDE